MWSLREQFTAEGHRKRSGKPWDRRTLLHMLRNPVYVGKLRWSGQLHDATHEPIVSPEVFEQAQAVLRDRSGDLKGRQWNNGSERLLTGIIRCGRCGGGLVGVSTRKRGQKFSYYACLTREREDGCDLEYLRADFIESVVLADVKTLFRDDAFIDQVWAETNRRLAEQRPDLEKDIAAATTERERALAKIDRYTEAFESGNLNPRLFGENVQALNAQVGQLEATRADLEAQAANLRLPALDRAHILDLLDNFEEVFASGTNPQRKHLLHQAVKEVRVLGGRSVEVTYFVPQPDPGAGPVIGQPHLAPRVAQCANRPDGRETATFRVFHRLGPGPNEAEPPPALGPINRTGTKAPLRSASWLEELATGAIPSRAALSRREGLSRARITQILSRAPSPLAGGGASLTSRPH